MSETLNPLIAAQERVKAACDKLNLDPAVYELLKEPQRFIEINIPVKMDDGTTKVFKGFRSAHCSAVGPTKGGVRFNPGVNADEVKALSLWMTFKGGTLGLPYGGGKGGIIVDPTELSDRELEQLCRGWVRGLYRYLGDRLDIPAPDSGTNGQIMSWFTDEYIKLNGDRMDIGVFTGKPVEFGGSQGRNESTGYGIGLIAKFMSEKVGLDFKKAKVAVQGFGNAGQFSVKNCQRLGATVVAVSEWDKKIGTYAIYDENGLDYNDLADYKAKNRTLIGYPKGKQIAEKDFWEGKYDIIIPAALENSITGDIAKNLNVKMVCEAGNGPTTPEADKVLNERGIYLTPDILTNSGGVLVSYYEWVQNQYGYYWSLEEVEKKQEEDMKKAFDNVYAVSQEYKVTMREAVYMYAIRSIDKAMKLRGWY